MITLSDYILSHSQCDHRVVNFIFLGLIHIGLRELESLDVDEVQFSGKQTLWIADIVAVMTLLLNAMR